MFRLLLWNVGVLLFVMSRISPRMRSQTARDFGITIASEDGVARTFLFENRIARSRSGCDSKAVFTLTFSTGWQAVRILLAGDGVRKTVDGLASGTISYKGDLPYLLWFYELIMAYVPWLNRSVHKTMPNNYSKPDSTTKVGKKIVREPAVEKLDPNWEKAHSQREKTLLWSVGKGGEIEGKKEGFEHVLSAEINER